MGVLECQTKWTGGLSFEAKARQHRFILDTKVENGGQDQGPSPKEVLLGSICVCSGMDAVSILQKMRTGLTACEVNAKTETTADYPSIFKTVELEYVIRGDNIKPEQAMRAVDLSMTKYCGVSAMVVGASPIHYVVFLNDVKIGQGQADFRKSSE